MALAYRPDIDGLRAVAVLAVVAYHAFPQALPGGFVGVDVFFVISGYLISTIILAALQQGRFRFRDFYVRRVVRIFPALVLVLAAALAYGWVALLAGEYRKLGTHTAAGAAFFANVAYWREAGYFDIDAQLKPLLHLWSLGVEEQFYILWPALLAGAYWRRLNVWTATAVLAALSFAINAGGIHSYPVATFFLPFSRLWELLLGALMAEAALVGPRWTWREGSAWPSSLAVTGIGLIATGAAILRADMAFPGGWALLPTVGSALVIAVGPDAWLNRAVLSRRPLVLIGLISYPLYLWHWPLLSFARHAGAGPLSLELVLALVAASIVLAWLTWRFVERPLRFPASGRLPVRAVALAAAMGVLATAGVVAATGRITTRLDRKFQFLSTYEYDYRSAYRGHLCHLSARQTAQDYQPECVDEGFRDGARTSVLLWGDSLASHLYPGLRELQAVREVALAQYTADRCLPLLEARTEFCRGLVQFVLDRLEPLAPDVVILASNWSERDLEALPNEAALGRLPGTIAALRQRGARQVIVVGPVPRWEQALPKAMIQFMQEHPLAPPPQRMRYALNPAPWALEAALKHHLAGVEADYVSALDVFCNDDGCMTEDHGTPVAWDNSHLTDAGSRLLARAVLDRVAGRAASAARQ